MNNPSNIELYDCENVFHDRSVVLNGVLYINTKDSLIFHNLDLINQMRYGRKMHLIPCNENLKNYIFREYDIFLYLKNHEDNFWVSIEGQFLTPDTLRRPQQFIIKSISIIDTLNSNYK
ncbi:MAG: hypothetical protein Q8K70_08885 [Bacteroidota bacterium]|nr:hypothetical protein [Bacteroidota bacterium]